MNRRRRTLHGTLCGKPRGTLRGTLCGKLGLLAGALLLWAAVPALPIGLTASCFLPRQGRFSHPVSPLSLRDIGFRLGHYVELSGDVSLYSLRGLGLEDPDGRPIAFASPPVGPALSVLGSAGAFAVLPIGKLELKAGGGLFGCWLPDPPLNADPIEAYLATATPAFEYEAVTASLSRASSGCWGGGLFFGGSLTWFIKGQIGVSLGARYYLGGAGLGLSGSYDAYDAENPGSPVDGAPLPPELIEARVDLDGLELLLGVSLRL